MITKKMTPKLAREIADRVINHGESLDHIAKDEFDRSHAWLSQALRNNGVTMKEEREKAAAERGRLVAEDYANGMTVAQLMRKHDLSKSHINALISRHQKQAGKPVQSERYKGIPAGKPYIPRVRREYKPDRCMQAAYARAREVYGDKTVRGM